MSELSKMHDPKAYVILGGVLAPRRHCPTFKGVNGHLIHVHKKSNEEKKLLKDLSKTAKYDGKLLLHTTF